MRTIQHATAFAVLSAAVFLRTLTPAYAADGTTSLAGLALTQVAALVAGGTAMLVVVALYIHRTAAAHAAELQAANERQRAIIDAIPDALFRIDAEGRVLEFKPSPDFELINPPEISLGKTVRELDLPAGLIIHWEAALKSTSRAGGHRTLEYQLDYPDGPHDFEARIVQASPEEYLAIVRDISARKQAEASDIAYRHQLEQTVTRRTSDLVEANVRLQETNRAKSAFLANMSHELRTPLNSVIGFSGTLLMGLAGEINEEQQRQLTMVQQAGRQLLSLVDDVLDYTRIESGRITALPTEFQLANLLGECLIQVRADAQIKGLGIELDVEHAPATIRTDRRLLGQVILNLLSNAVKFTEKGSVSLRATANDEHVVIEVCDTGVGIDPDLKNVIFNTFEQGMSHLSAKPEGLGLGLTICYELTRLLGGTIALDGEVDHGTTARLTLPLHLESPSTKPPAESCPEDVSPPH
ncbi:MAG: ATP-binding protein [Coriobacteriia bacterium]|nr:ATP-binding protein [Coriobacteriia bacterium]